MPINTLPDSLQPDDCSDELRRADDLRENKKKTEEATLSTARRVLLRLQRLGGPALPALECPLSGEPRFMAPGCGGRQQPPPPAEPDLPQNVVGTTFRFTQTAALSDSGARPPRARSIQHTCGPADPSAPSAL